MGSFKYAFCFFLLLVFFLYAAAITASRICAILLSWVGVAFLGVVLAYLGMGGRIFLKSTSGKLRTISYLLFWPFLLMSQASLWIWRCLGRASPVDEIEEGIYLGCRLGRMDSGRFAELKIGTVLDLTAEFSEPDFISKNCAYLNIPLLDACAPSPEQLRTGVGWLLQERQKGKVFVHCALGHGRNATFVAALLMAQGRAASVDEAIQKIQAKRRGIGLNRTQRAALEAWRRKFIGSGMRPTDAAQLNSSNDG